MKKTLALLLLLAGVSYAESGRVHKSSFTNTNDTACIQATYLSKVLVPAASATGGTLIIYNSTWTTSGVPIVSSVTLTSANHYDFDDAQVKGICYTTVTNTNGVNIIYAK